MHCTSGASSTDALSDRTWPSDILKVVNLLFALFAKLTLGSGFRGVGHRRVVHEAAGALVLQVSAAAGLVRVDSSSLVSSLVAIHHLAGGLLGGPLVESRDDHQGQDNGSHDGGDQNLLVVVLSILVIGVGLSGSSKANRGLDGVNFGLLGDDVLGTGQLGVDGRGKGIAGNKVVGCNVVIYVTPMHVLVSHVSESLRALNGLRDQGEVVLVDLSFSP